MLVLTPILSSALHWTHLPRPNPVSSALQWTTHLPVRPTVEPRAPGARLGLGFQIDAGASVGSLFVLSGFVALQLRIRTAEASRSERDAAVEALRLTQGELLVGKCTADDVRRAAEAALGAADAYDDVRRVIALPGALLRIPDPNRDQARRLLEPYSPKLRLEREAERAEEAAGAGAGDKLDGVRQSLGLRDTAEQQGKGSLLPSGSDSVTLKDVAIGFVLILQIAWCAGHFYFLPQRTTGYYYSLSRRESVWGHAHGHGHRILSPSVDHMVRSALLRTPVLSVCAVCACRFHYVCVACCVCVCACVCVCVCVSA